MNASSLGTVLEVCRSEGLQAVVDRTRDRLQEARRRRNLAALTVSNRELELGVASPPVLNVSPIPPSPKRGGSHIQMLDRLAVERLMRTVALTYPRDGRWWLEVWAGEWAGIAAIGAQTDPAEAVSLAAGLVGIDTVHVENLHGLPLDLIPNLEGRGLRTVLAIHDFTLFCRRPHLIDSSTGGFCEYSRDEMRCTNCLRGDDSHRNHGQQRYRELGGNTLGRANAVVFPSAFLRQRHRDLFPERRPDQREVVIAPATEHPQAFGRNTLDRPRIAFVGGVHHHKGGALIPGIMAAIRETHPTSRGFVYGDGERALLDGVRRTRGVRIRGYYSQGRLPQLLARDRIAVAILPSIWPEAYALVADECLAASVPLVAFDLGAVGDRLRGWGVGVLASDATGATGLADAALLVLRGRHRVSDRVIAELPLPIDAAREHIELYQNLTANRR